MSQNTGPETTTAVALSPRQERAIAARDSMEAGAVKPAPLVPRTFQEAQAFAGALSESPLMPADLKKNAANVLVVILAGVELGLLPMQSIRLHHVIEGVPRLSSVGIGAIVLASPLCEYLRCTEHTETSVTWITKRVGEPEMSMTWNEARAKKAGKWGSGTWAKYPANMLSARARKELCEIVYPDLIAGLISSEEAEDMATDKERSGPPVFVAPQGPPPGVPVPPKEEKKPRAPRSATIDAQSTERPTPPVTSKPSTAPAASSSPSPTASGSASSSPASAGTTSAASGSSPAVDRFGQNVAPPTDHVAALDDMPKTPPSKLDEARAKVEAKRERPTAAPVTSSDSDASENSGGNAPEPSEGDPEPGWDDDENAAPEETEPEFTIAGFHRWLATIKPSTTVDELKIAAAPWVTWSAKEFAKGSKELQEIRDAYARVKAGLQG